QFQRASKSFIVTSLGREASKLYDENKVTELNNFMYQRLLEYPYAVWLIRLLGKNPTKKFSKFDLAENFGFIDELGFGSIPVQIYLNSLAQAEIENDKEAKKKIKSNFEGTSDKYMRWLAGVLVKSGLATATSEKVRHEYNGKDFSLSVGPMYQITAKGLTALKQVNGGSRYSRSPKRVMWEFLATKDKNASVLKTSRSLILKYLSEKKNPISPQKLADSINADYPKLEITPEEIIDDCKGLERIGIEITNLNDELTLKEKLLDFEIPIEREAVLEKTDIDKFKNLIRSRLTHISHSYLKGIDIAAKKKTTKAENTEFEVISTQLFTDELGFLGQHLGGSNRPDGLVWDKDCAFILDSKAYSEGFPLTAHHTDAMRRYLRQFEERDEKIIPTWWDISPKGLANTYFAYVSGSFAGKYEMQLKNFRQGVGIEGGALEFVKLLLLANQFKAEKITKDEVKAQILDYNIAYKDYEKNFS
ncbi:MAG: restriction endonuclease, partial [Streptococcaceae bacterium]|nr:restriction endonuclease [Streptococcaceae bacterium]